LRHGVVLSILFKHISLVSLHQAATKKLKMLCTTNNVGNAEPNSNLENAGVKTARLKNANKFCNEV